MSHAAAPSEEDVLDDFLSEPQQDRATLELYLRLYPMHVGPLLDLHAVIVRQQAADAHEPQALPDAVVSAAAARFRQRFTPSADVDPFQGLTPARFNAIKASLGVRSGTLTAFRDRQVAGDTVPLRTLQAFADALGTGLQAFKAFLALPPRHAMAQSFRSDGRPHVADEKRPLRDILIAANEPAAIQARLLDEDA